MIHLLDLGRFWAESGYDVHFVTNQSDSYEGRYPPGTSLHVLRSLTSVRSLSSRALAIDGLINHFLQVGEVAKLLMYDDPRRTLVLTMSPFPSDILTALFARKRRGFISIAYFHHISPPPWLHPLRRGGIPRATLSWLSSQFALVIAKISGVLPALYHPKELYHQGWRFDYVVQDSLFLELDGPPHTSDSISRTTDACYVGRVAPSKGILDLLTVWERLRNWGLTPKLVIAGPVYSSGFEQRIRKETVARGLEAQVIRIARYISSEEKKQLLETSRIFLFPSYEEGWSFGVMEAIRFGAVPVVYDLPAYDYLSISGVRAPLGDTKSMATIVRTLLEHPERLHDYQKTLRNDVESLNPREIAHRQIELLVSLLRAA